jgi:hypothetical protein
MRFVTTWSLLLVACYASHSIDGDADTGPVADVSAFDALALDGLVAPILDAPTFDVLVLDAPSDTAGDAGIRCRAFRLVDQALVDWPSADCGAITFPRVTAVSGDEGPFQILATEFRSCFDREARLLTRRIGVDGEMIRVGAEATVGVGEGVGSIASNGREFAVCSGTMLHTNSLIEPEPLQPACMNNALCVGLAFDGAGWGVGWRPGCDASAQVSRAGFDGGQREAPISIDIQDSIASIASSSDGFGALSFSPTAISLFHWPRASPGPTYIPVEDGRPQNGIVALSAWPFVRGAWVVYTIEDLMLRAHVFGAEGELLIDQLYEVSLPSYEPSFLRASSSPAGAAIVISYVWTGGRIDAATRLMVLGPDGFPIGEDVAIDLGPDTRGGADVVMSGRSILVHRGARARDTGATEVLLYECF